MQKYRPAMQSRKCLSNVKSANKNRYMQCCRGYSWFVLCQPTDRLTDGLQNMRVLSTLSDLCQPTDRLTDGLQNMRVLSTLPACYCRRNKLPVGSGQQHLKFRRPCDWLMDRAEGYADGHDKWSKHQPIIHGLPGLLAFLSIANAVAFESSLSHDLHQWRRYCPYNVIYSNWSCSVRVEGCS
jgi:hypothetical protein